MPTMPRKWSSTRTREEVRASGDYFRVEIPPLPEISQGEIDRRFDLMRPVAAFADRLMEGTSMVFGTMLDGIESDIGGRAYMWRLRPIEGGYLSLKHAIWLVDNQGEVAHAERIPSWMSVDFPGIPLMDGSGAWFTPCVRRRAGALVLELRRMGAGFNERCRIAQKQGPPSVRRSRHRVLRIAG